LEFQEARRKAVNHSRIRIASVLAIAAMVAGACSSTAATTAPTATPVPATPTTVASIAASASVAPSAAALPVIPADQLIKAGTLTVCSDTSYPPQETLDSSNKAIGSDIDLITEVAKRLGLTLSVKSTVFDSIIPALTGGTCDISISAQTINADRQAKLDMIPYFAAGQSFVVLKGNPSNIKTLDDLCGKTVAAEKGTVEADHITGGASGYDDTTALSPLCKSKGKAAITLKVFDADTAALLALQSGTVQAHFTDEPVAFYEVTNGNGKFEVVPALTLERSPEGICVTKNHTGLRDAVKAAVQQMMDDGTYLQILTKWNVQSGAITSTAASS
jgi:polar amino acid transport system substrate-binding protein